MEKVESPKVYFLAVTDVELVRKDVVWHPPSFFFFFLPFLVH